MADGKPDNSTHAEIKSLSDKFDTVHKKIDQSSAELRSEIDKKFQETKQERIEDKNAVAAALRETEDRHEKAEKRSARRIGWYITISIASITLICGLCTYLLKSYLNSVHEKLGDMTVSLAATNTEIKNLAVKHSEQSIEFARFGERLNHQSELRTLFHKMESEVQGMKLEIERLKKE